MSVSHFPWRESSRLSLGLWRLADWQMTAGEVRSVIRICLELGITTIDQADIYGNYTSESLFGRVLQQETSLRERLQIVSKCGIKLVSSNRPAHTIKHYDTSRAHILASVDRSLTQMHTDYLDVLLIHRPNPLMDADETAEAFNRLKQSGKVLHFGVSNFTPSQYDLLASRLDFPLVTNQVEISVLQTEAFDNGTLDRCQQLRISPMAWSPLGGGRLFSGEGLQEKRLQVALSAVGEQLGGATIFQVALAWLLFHPAKIIPILGTGKIERIRAAAAAESLQLTIEQWFTIWVASTGKNVP